MSRSWLRLLLFALLVGAALAWVIRWWPKAQDPRVLSEMDTEGAAKEEFHDWFVEARLQRERDLFLWLETLLKHGGEAEARSEYVEALRRHRLQNEAEELLRLRGFDDALVYLDGEGAVVIVRAEAISRADAALVAELVSRLTGVPKERISVSHRAK